MRFHYTQSLSEEETAALLDWSADVFQSEPLNLFWRPKELHLVGYVEGRPVSKCGLLRHRARVGDQWLPLGGIGGVVTPPQYQGRGYAGDILQEALRCLREDWRRDAALLFCRQPLVTFYQKHGWELVTHPVEILQPQGKIVAPVPAMYYPLRAAWPDGPVALDSMPW